MNFMPFLEFIIGLSTLALTEDGQIYSWCRKVTGVLSCIASALKGLDTGRHPEPFDFPSPVAVTGSLTGEKVVQVASSGGRHVLAVTLGGDVHQWDWPREPSLIAGEKFGDQKVVSVACNNYLNVALTEDGEVC